MRNERNPRKNRGDEQSEVTVYQISVVAQMVETHPQTLRMYERMGLISPQRTRNNIRLYSEEDVARVRRIQHLTQELGVNLAGVEVVFKLLSEIDRLVEERSAREAAREAAIQGRMLPAPSSQPPPAQQKKQSRA
jgi:MerR family transcriptional regulator/heat shock protein HspR